MCEYDGVWLILLHTMSYLISFSDFDTIDVFLRLLKQPDSHGLPSIEINLQDSDTSQTKISDGEGISSKSEASIAFW